MPKRVLIFDLETTGLFKPCMKAPLLGEDTDAPEPVSICWKFFAQEEMKYFICKPTRASSPESEKVHKITKEMIAAEGVDTSLVLDDFLRDALSADMIVGHNVYFDRKVVRATLLRMKRADDLAAFERIPASCTMLAGHSIFRFPVPGHPERNKWPKLVELAAKVGVEVDETKTHDARYDVSLTEKCLARIFNTVAKRVHDPERQEAVND
jgi:DNA polymerase III epsilon subunit-like protein